MTKIKALLTALMLCAASVPFADTITANAEDGEYPLGILSPENYSKEVDWDLWDTFLKYDLCITDYDSLTDEEKELCRFIFVTERSADDTIRCERARYKLADRETGERITLSELSEYDGIRNKYYIFRDYKKSLLNIERHCVPDIDHIDDELGISEYWLDDSGTERILCESADSPAFVSYETYGYVKQDDSSQSWSCETIDKAHSTESEMYELDGLTYAILSNNTAVLVNCDEFKKTHSEPVEKLVIPSEINGCPLIGLEYSALVGVPAAEIELPEGLLYIGRNAFAGNDYLEKISLPHSLQVIGEYAFMSCSNLKNIEINAPDVILGSFLFMATPLENVVLDVKTIDIWAFKGCESLESVTLGENVEKIGYEAFMDCTNLKSVNISSDLRVISQGAFLNTGISELTIQPETEIIGALPPSLGHIIFSGLEDIPANDPLTDEPEDVFDNDFTINGYYNTEAHSYAIENDLKFNALDELLYGDTNMDGSINVADAVVLQNYLLRGESVGYEADLNKDGRIDVFDMIAMRNSLIM